MDLVQKVTLIYNNNDKQDPTVADFRKKSSYGFLSVKCENFFPDEKLCFISLKIQKRNRDCLPFILDNETFKFTECHLPDKDSTINSETIKSLVNCTKLLGALQIHMHVFLPYSEMINKR